MDAESLERPVLAVTAEGRWRLYLSCATTGTKHWRVEMLEAAAPDAFDPRQRAVILPGDHERADQGPGDRAHRQPVAHVGVHPPADRPRAHRPDVGRVRHQRRRAGLGVARTRPAAPARPLGQPGRADQRCAARDRRRHRLLRRPGQRRRELRGADRAGGRAGARRAGRGRSRPRPRSRRPPGTGCATSASCRCAMAARASTTRSPAKTERTSCAPSCAEAVGTGGTEPFSTPAAGRCGPVAGPQAGPPTSPPESPAAPASR